MPRPSDRPSFGGADSLGEDARPYSLSSIGVSEYLLPRPPTRTKDTNEVASAIPMMPEAAPSERLKCSHPTAKMEA